MELISPLATQWKGKFILAYFIKARISVQHFVFSYGVFVHIRKAALSFQARRSPKNLKWPHLAKHSTVILHLWNANPFFFSWPHSTASRDPNSAPGMRPPAVEAGFLHILRFKQPQTMQYYLSLKKICM